MHTSCSLYLVSSVSLAISHKRSDLSSDPDIIRTLSQRKCVTLTGLQLLSHISWYVHSKPVIYGHRLQRLLVAWQVSLYKLIILYVTQTNGGEHQVFHPSPPPTGWRYPPRPIPSSDSRYNIYSDPIGHWNDHFLGWLRINLCIGHFVIEKWSQNASHLKSRTKPSLAHLV